GDVADAGDGQRAGLADGGERLADVLALHHADGHHGRVGALAVGDGPGEVAGFLDGGEGVRRAELQGPVTLERHRVDGDDHRGAGVAGALHGVDADAADAHDDVHVAGPDAAGDHRRTPPGRHAAADEGGLPEGDVVVDLDHAPLGNHGVLRERTRHGRLGHVVAVDVHAERAVDLGAHEHHGAVVAEVLQSLGAPATPSAARHEGEDDVVARLHAADGRTDLLHD